MKSTARKPLIAIACGGSGGHLFPGLATAEALQDRGCDIMLMISQKEVDQHAVGAVTEMELVVLPAIGLTRGNRGLFAKSFYQSFRQCRALFKKQRPDAVLAMGGFTSAPPLMAGKMARCNTFLHESNTIPGRANRWLSRFVNRSFVGFYETAPRLSGRHVIRTGTPTRTQFQSTDEHGSRRALGLDPNRPVLLIQGGSQGARSLNRFLLEALPLLVQNLPELQYLHLSGEKDAADLQSTYRNHQCKAVVRPFLTEMEMALGAATAAVSRSGASSLAELAAMRLPSILVPYPTAVENHQYWNARSLTDQGAAYLLEEKSFAPESFVELVTKLVTDKVLRSSMQKALEKCHSPYAADLMADKILGMMPEHDLDQAGRGYRKSDLPIHLQQDSEDWSSSNRWTGIQPGPSSVPAFND